VVFVAEIGASSGSVTLEQIVAAFAADAALDQAVALGATLQFQGNFSLRAGADNHFDSFLEQVQARAGVK
jgi:hypothetical protein